jgi:HAD superfamily hydrolase (TIGR01509 family)
MQQIKWFNRIFQFGIEENSLPAVIERLEGTPLLLEHKCRQITPGILNRSWKNTWSIKENIGHLCNIIQYYMGYKGIIFDMDGTLIDSEHLHLSTWDELLKEYHLHFTKEWFENWIGISDVNLSRQITEEYKLNIDWRDLLENKRNLFRKRAEKELKTMEGVHKGLEQLKQLPMAVATMSNRFDAEMSFKVTGISHYFKGLITVDDVLNHKPHPEPYEKAATLLQLPATHCLALEDSISGVQSAKAAGCYTIAVANTIEPEKLTEANLVLENTEMAMKFLVETLLLASFKQ